MLVESGGQWSSIASVDQCVVAVGPILLGIDDTLERRKGAKIKAKGLYRDAVRSSQTQVVKAHGLRWLSVMLLVQIPWAQRVWALPLDSLSPVGKL